MTNPRLFVWRGLLPLSITVVVAACTQPTPVIRQPYSNGGGSGDGGLPSGNPGTGGIPGNGGPPVGNDAGSGIAGNPGMNAGGSTGANGGGGGTPAAGGSSGAGGVTGAGGSPTGSGGRGGSGGTMTGMGGAAGSGGTPNSGMPDAGRMDMTGSGGRPVMDAPLESSSLDVSPPPIDTGVAPGVACMKSSWTVEANKLCTMGQCTLMLPSRKEPKYAADGDEDTRYTSGAPQGSAGAETLIVTFPAPVSITGLTITSQVGDGAASYRIESSTDGRAFMAFQPALEGNGSDNIVLTFPAKTLKALRITQTGMKTTPWWSVHEISVAGCTTP